jgi:N-methylhydantoinase A
MSSLIRMGVDVGGTFTDFVLVDGLRDRIYTGKRLTTEGDPSQAILDGAQRLVDEASITIGQIAGVIHGTTLVANTIIERSGAKVGLITTRGFRDSIAIGRELRYDLYDLLMEQPQPLVPRHLRLEVDERLDALGTVLRPLDEAQLRDAVTQLTTEKVEAIAICFLHAYRNDIHEKRARAIVQAMALDVPVSISSEVAPEIREFERSSTTTANAYVQPLMQGYLARLEERLKAQGLVGHVHVMLSGGGATTIRAAQAFPIRLIESGPAAGAMAASFYARLMGLDHVISFDMGGTTAKMCLIDDCRPQHAHEFEAARVRRFRKGSGLPLKVPVIDLIEIGAGGGSMARIDGMGLLKVGPESAGADPGPICYQRGGTQPTVTDADLVLGYLSPDYFLGGEMQLDLASVRESVAALGAPLKLDVTATAAGIHSIVNENMAAATRMYVAEKGRDPRQYSMIAFGGAGPVHAYGLAKLLKLRRIVCPLGAGVMSALGLLVAPPAIDYVRSYVTRLNDIDWRHVNQLFDGMEREARRLLTDAGAQEVTFERRADMRHVGQGFEIDVPLPNVALGPDALGSIRESFLTTYNRMFDRRVESVPIEALSWRLTATAPMGEVALNFVRPGESGSRAPLKGRRQVHFAGIGFVDCPVYDRYGLRVGDHLDGPAVIEERESTIIVGPDGRITIDRFLSVVIDISAGTVKQD